MKLTELFTALGDSNPTFEGTGWIIHCPGHNDSQASLRVALGTGLKVIVKCRAGCKTDALLATKGLSFSDLMEVPRNMPDTPLAVTSGAMPAGAEEQTLMAAYLHQTKQLIQASSHARLGGEAYDYLWQRFGLSVDQANDLGIGVDDGSISYGLLGQAYKVVPRVVVPFKDFRGIPRGFQSRALEDTRVKWSGPSNPAEGSWSKHAFMGAYTGLDNIVVTEGPGDGLTAHAAGYDAIAIRGASLAKSVAESVVLFAEMDDRPFVLAGDNDDAGRQFNADLADVLIPAGYQVFALAIPEQFNDLSEWYEGSLDTFVQEFQEAVTGAKAVTREATNEEDKEANEDLQQYATDHGLAIFLQEFLEGNVLHSPGLGFFLYHAGAWERDTLDTIRNSAHEAADQLSEDAEAEYEAKILELERDRADQDAFDMATRLRATKRKMVKRLKSTRTLDQALTELAAMINVDPQAFDSHGHLITVANGTINLRTGELGPHDRDHLITHRLDIAYDDEASCPRWHRFLSEIFPGQAKLPPYIQRLIGYGITGETSEQCFAVLWGLGANGKSVFTDTLSRVFASISSTTPFTTFEKKAGGGSIPNDLAALRGSRLVFASEGELGTTMAEATLKRVTGQDLIAARFMRAEFFEFRPSFLILLATNHKPSFRGQDEGLWRRVKLIPFSRYFKPEERDHTLVATMTKDEAQGILTWAVQGAAEWYASGLKEPPVVVAATADYKATSDDLAGFYPDGPLVRGTRDEAVTLTDAFKTYETWADEEEIPDKERWGRRTFSAKMEERGALRTKKTDGIHLTHTKTCTESQAAGDTYSETTTQSDSIFGGAR